MRIKNFPRGILFFSFATTKTSAAGAVASKDKRIKNLPVSV
jgi:hypothetical protein